MLSLRRLPLVFYLLWSMLGFALQLVVAMMGRQRVFITVLLVIGIIVLSSSVSNAVIVSEARELALSEPPAGLVGRTTTVADSVILTPLRRPAAEQLWKSYKTELATHGYNHHLLNNLVLLASALDLEKDATVYQRQLYANDPLLLCVFLENENGTLAINCDQP